jgi:hypothetical protein
MKLCTRRTQPSATPLSVIACDWSLAQAASQPTVVEIDRSSMPTSRR